MKNLLSVLPFLILIILTTSCSHKYYAPNDGEFLVLTKRNDLHLSQSFSAGRLVSTSTQLGYSPIKYLGLSGSFFQMKGKLKRVYDNPLKRKGDGKIWNTAIGAYYPFIFDSKIPLGQSHQSGILVDIYFGYGKGEVNNYYEVGGSSHFKFDKKYTQLGIYFISGRINIGYQLRIGRLNYSEGKIYGQANRLAQEGFNRLRQQNDFKLIENSLQFSYGTKHFRVYIASTGITNNKNLNKLGVKKTNTTIGFILELDEFFRKNKSEEVKKSIDF